MLLYKNIKVGVIKLQNLIGIVVSYLFIFLIIIGAKLFEKTGKEASRKFIHIALGNWWIIAMYFFNNVWFASFVPATFVVINYISYKKDIIKVMERDENNKEGLGTVYYALSLLILTIVTFGILNKPVLGLVSVFIMAYGDGLAAIFGRLIQSKKYKIYDTEKSIAGSFTMFIVSFIILAIYLIYINSPLWYIKAIVISIVIAILEAVSIKGTDNITVPIASLLMLMFI